MSTYYISSTLQRLHVSAFFFCRGISAGIRETCYRVSVRLAIDPKYISKLVFGSYLLVPGLTYKKLNRLEESLDCFMKLHAILRNSAEVMYQLANLYPTDTKCFHVFENVYVCASRGLTDLNLS